MALLLAAIGIYGIVASIALGLALTRVLASLPDDAPVLFGVSATDPLTFGGVTAFLGLIALVACYVPARRAARVDPMVTLRDGSRSGAWTAARLCPLPSAAIWLLSSPTALGRDARDPALRSE